MIMKQTGEAFASLAVRRVTISIPPTQLYVKTTAPGHLAKTGLNVYVCLTCFFSFLFFSISKYMYISRII